MNFNRNIKLISLIKSAGYALVLWGFGIVHCGAVLAEEVEGFYSLSLEDLLDVSVSVASKSAGTAADAPGVVTVFSKNDIDATGYYTLSDLANITPGYSNYRLFGEEVFETRGQKAGSFENNKHLLLINGIPVNHARANKALIEEEIPLHFADKVEFLRGPASALYGVGAFYGVVSITPQSLAENGTKVETKYTGALLIPIDG